MDIMPKSLTVTTSAPVILSVSRSTDIPAFYAEWFVNRLREGYAVWYNPFNQKPMRVSFERVKVIVFWTKNPAPLIPYLSELDRRGVHYYFQFTLNDYEWEGFESRVPPLDQRIDTFRQLSDLLGKERIIWRFDPLLLAPGLSPRQLLARIWRLGNRLQGSTDKLVFSFVDVLAYRKVQQNLLRETACFTPENIASAEPSETQRIALAEGLAFYEEIKQIVAEGDTQEIDCTVRYYRDPQGRQIVRKLSRDGKHMLVLAHVFRAPFGSCECAAEGFAVKKAYTTLGWEMKGGKLVFSPAPMQAGAFLLEKA